MFEEKVREIIARHVGVDPELLNDDDDILDDLGASSLDAIEIVCEIEDTFGIKIDDAQIIDNRHVGDACSFIANYMSGNE